MGTRADFYVGRGESAEWIGSITWDGYPDGIDGNVFESDTEDSYRRAVDAFFVKRDDVTRPTEFWPWPWETSATTDYAYAFEDGVVYASSFGHSWFEVDLSAENCGEPEEDTPKDAVFPDMTSRRGSYDDVMSRSGLIVVSMPTNPTA
ncbi:hypothetical protein ACWEOE_10750 [Amycolatopsis sp. NPDC004368]